MGARIQTQTQASLTEPSPLALILFCFCVVNIFIVRVRLCHTESQVLVSYLMWAPGTSGLQEKQEILLVAVWSPAPGSRKDFLHLVIHV